MNSYSLLPDVSRKKENKTQHKCTHVKQSVSTERETRLMVFPALSAHLYIGTEGKTGEGIDVRWGRFLRSHLYNIACSINKTVRSFLAFQCAR